MESANEKTIKKHSGWFWLFWLLISLVIMGASMIGSATLYHYGAYKSKEAFRLQWNERLLKNYAIYALSDRENNYNIARLNQTNFHFGVYQSENGESADLGDRSIYLISNLEDSFYYDPYAKNPFLYSATIGETTTIHPNISSIFDNGVLVNYWYSESDDVTYTNYYVVCYAQDPLDTTRTDLFTESVPFVNFMLAIRFVLPVIAILFAIASLFFGIMFLRCFFQGMRNMFSMLRLQWHGQVPLLARTILVIVLYCAIEFFILIAGRDEDALIFFFFLGHIIMIPLILLHILQLRRISNGAAELAKGDLGNGLNTEYLFYDYKKIADNMNDLRAGMESAVAERMKSEHFKTELISNVSHDIKTPLTSIINYTELLSQAPEDEPANREYLDVLRRQSVKLKKLLEDLIEASKASSGNLKVESGRCNVNTMLHQILGEYEERLQEQSVDLRIAVPEGDICILADAAHLQRIFDNLMTNIAKYAQPLTRAYVNLTDTGDQAVIEFKNTSKDPLNMSAEEFMERFTRGDESRNSDGHGLGLSIARSLTELMGGTLEPVVDGDLFKVVLRFPKVE